MFTLRFALVVTAGLCYFMALGMLLPVVPLFVKHELGGNDIAVGVAVGVFSVGAVLIRPFAGRIGDRVGGVSSSSSGASSSGRPAFCTCSLVRVSRSSLVRVLARRRRSAFFVGAASMITDLAPEERRGEAISYWSIAVYGGLAFGPLLGNILLDDDHFDRVWLTSATLAFVAGAIGLFTHDVIAFDPRDRGGAPRPPLISRAALAPGAVLFLGLIGLAGFTEFVPLYVKEIGMEDSSGVFLVYGCLILAVRSSAPESPTGSARQGRHHRDGDGRRGVVDHGPCRRAGGLVRGTVVFSIGMSFLYPAMLTLALTGLADNERGSVVGTVSSFFDRHKASGRCSSAFAALAGYRGALLLARVARGGGAGGAAHEQRHPHPARVDHDAAAIARGSVEPDLPDG